LRWSAAIKRRLGETGAGIAPLLPVIAGLLTVVPTWLAAERPQYGGVLRVELRAASVILQPSKWKPGSIEFATNERLAELLLDRLVSLDNYGRFQPQLATEWSHDAAGRRWQFALRQGVKFSDGSLLTSADVVMSLQPLLPRGMQMTATAGSVTFQCATAANDLLEMLASGPYFVYKDDGNGLPRGTGPFALESATAIGSEGSGTPTQRLRFRANQWCWAGRPYLDAVEVTLGVPAPRALLDLQLGKADLAELSVDTSRRAEQSRLKFWTSAPLTLYALKFAGEAKTDNEASLRQAIGLSLDRDAMASVLLQKQAEPAGAFLPQWLSGYAFLFDVEGNVERTKELRAKLPGNGPGVIPPLHLNQDANSELAKLIAERIAVSARAAGLTLQTVKSNTRVLAEAASSRGDGDVQLIAWRYTTLSPRRELERLAAANRWQVPDGGVPEEAEARYAWEKRMIEEKNLVPVVVVRDVAAADGRVRNWSPASWGDWRLADVWLEGGEAASAGHEPSSRSSAGAKP
jgi:ABC-type transport system substrate-binding protein